MACVVIGAGIAGLATAHALRARKTEVLVLESEPRAGGKIRSDRHDGFLVESGPQSFLDQEPTLRALVRSLGLASRVVPTSSAARRRQVVWQGRPVPVPTSPLAFLTTSLLRAQDKARLLADLVLPRGNAGEDESVADFARRRFGRAAAERFLYPLVSGLYAGDPAALSVSASLPWLAELEREHRSVILGALRLRAEAGLRAELLSFQGGMEELVRSLASSLGDALRLSAAVSEVEPTWRGFRVTFEQDGHAQSVLADAVVLALPAYAGARLVSSWSPRLADAVGAIPYAKVGLVNAGYEEAAFARAPDAYGFLVPPGERSSLLGAVFSSTVLPGRAPPGTVLISARVGGACRPELVDLPDEALVGRVHAELRSLLPVRRPPCFVRVVRHEHALPQYTLGHRWRVAAVDAAEREHPGLFLTGSAYRGVGVAHCVRDAHAVAERVAVYLGPRTAKARSAA
jgi:oxygen-dependent protoporphyrinogen oxidase